MVKSANFQKQLTVCIPCYNVEKYITQCLQSIVCVKQADWLEVLVVDDGSQDSSATLAEEIQQQYPSIVRLIRKKNGGHGSTINTALANASGMYFMVVDGDDWVDSAQLESLLSKLISQQIEADLICSPYFEMNMQSNEQTLCTQKATLPLFEAIPFEKLPVEMLYFTLAGTIFKTQCLRDCHLHLQENTYYVDVEYILFPIPQIQTAMFTDCTAYRYRRGLPEQSVAPAIMLRRYNDHERVVKRVITYANAQPMSSSQHHYFSCILHKVLYTHYSLFMMDNPDKKAAYVQGGAFDCFLKNTSPDLYQWIGREMPSVRIARKYNFDYDRVKNSFDNKMLNLYNRLKQNVKLCLAKLKNS